MAVSGERIYTYDIAKGIGILIVMIGHSLTFGVGGNLFIYSFHMPLFFILSGLVMKDEGSNSFSLKYSIYKERKLILNYVFYSCVYLIFDIVVRGLALHQRGANMIVMEFGQTVVLFGINVLWFISTLFLGKLIVRAISSKIRNIVLQIIIAIALFAVGCALASFLPESISEMGYVSQGLYYVAVSVIRAIMMSCFVLLGFAVRKHIKKIVTSTPPVVGGGMRHYCNMYNSLFKFARRNNRLPVCTIRI